MPLALIINGHERNFENLDAGTTLNVLLEELAVLADRVAVELNGTIAPRNLWQSTVLTDQDKIEMVHFVGGGRGNKGNTFD